jgi:hypothetical protein
MQDPNAAPDARYVPPQPPYEPQPKSRRGLVIAVVLVLLVAGAGGFVALAGGLMKSNDAYRNAMAHASADCRVAEAVGTPLDAGYFVSGSVETSNGSGHAELAIPVDGSTGSGTLHVVADRSAEAWSFRQLELEVDDDGRRIDLLAASGCAAGAPGAAPVAGSSPGALKGTAQPAADPAVAPAAAPAQPATPAPAPDAGGVAKAPVPTGSAAAKP